MYWLHPGRKYYFEIHSESVVCLRPFFGKEDKDFCFISFVNSANQSQEKRPLSRQLIKIRGNSIDFFESNKSHFFFQK